MLDELGYIAGQEKNGTDSSAIMARDRTAVVAEGEEEEEGDGEEEKWQTKRKFLFEETCPCRFRGYSRHRVIEDE